MPGDIELRERQLLPEQGYTTGAPSVVAPLDQRPSYLDLRPLFFSALFWAGIPALLVAVYMFAFAADQYRATAQFVVRGNTNPVGGDGPSGNFAAMITLNTSQDTYIAASLIGEGGILGRVAAETDLRRMFGRPEQDFVARLSEDADDDDLARYWSKMVKAEVDPIAGIVTVEASAFTPDDASYLVLNSIKYAEERLNELHTSYLKQSAQLAAERVDDSTRRLAVARADIKRFREETQVIDMTQGANSAFQILADLRRQRMETRAQLAVERARSSADAPKARLLQRRLDALDKQIATIQAELTSKAGGDITTISAAIEAYDTLMLKQSVAEEFLARAFAARDAATQRLDRRDIYLETFVPPQDPEDSRLPRRWHAIFLTLLIALAIWATVRLFYASTMEHEG